MSRRMAWGAARLWQWLARRADQLSRASAATDRAALAMMRFCERRAAEAVARAIGSDAAARVGRERKP